MAIDLQPNDAYIHTRDVQITRLPQLHLAHVLTLIEQNDANYDRRYGLVFRALSIALQLGYTAGVRIDPKEPDWPVVFIELPTGQVTWHVTPHPVEWDNHTTEEKYQRVRAYTERIK